MYNVERRYIVHAEQGVINTKKINKIKLSRRKKLGRCIEQKIGQRLRLYKHSTIYTHAIKFIKPGLCLLLLQFFFHISVRN